MFQIGLGEKMLEEFVRIPLKRVAALIGKSGKTKREIEKKTKTKIEIDSDSGEVSIESKDTKGESFNDFFKAVNIVKAIGRGFSPEHAFRLLRDEEFLEIMELEDFLRTPKEIETKKARVIGEKGKARSEIEAKTGANISVFGKTIAIIGRNEEIEKARKAVEMLLQGARHVTVYNFLNKGEFGEREEFEI